MDLKLRDRNWFGERPNQSQITTSVRHLLENYSNIPPERVEDHVVDVRNEAWEIFPNSTIGLFMFFNLNIKSHDEYPEILRRLGEGQRLLDMGCGFGQAIRQLVADGAPAENIYGCNLREEYNALGYKLFSDKDTLKSKFITSNIFDATSALTELAGHFDMIYTKSFFHLWCYEDQIKVSKAVAALLRPRPGSLLLGSQIGTNKSDVKVVFPMGPFLHNIESFKSMWKDIADDIGVSFAVGAKLEVLDMKWLEHLAGLGFLYPSDARRIWFTVRRE